jgi:DivIVA domain-containing protein
VQQHDPKAIRDVSFTLAVEGYNPEQVDLLLVDLATAIEQQRQIGPELADLTRLEVVPAGYAVAEVEAFVNELADRAGADTRPDSAEAGGDAEQPAEIAAPTLEAVGEPDDAAPVAAAEASGEASQPDAVEDVQGTPAGDAAAAEESVVGMEGLADAAHGTLTHAVERTKQTVVELEVFLNQQLELAKTACQEAIAHTNDDCASTMQTARSITQAAYTTVEGAADELRAELTDAVARLHQDFDRQLAFTKRTFQQNLQQCQDEISTALNRVLDDARSRTAAITADITEIQSRVELSLADARSVLSTEQRQAA